MTSDADLVRGGYFVVVVAVLLVGLFNALKGCDHYARQEDIGPDGKHAKCRECGERFRGRWEPVGWM